jgi:TP901 family phage tail tape measure protein
MSTRTSDLDVRVRLRNQRQFNRQVRESAAELEAMGVKGANAMGAFATKAKGLRDFGRNWTRNVSLPIVGFGAIAGRMSMQFSDALEQVHTQAGATQGEVDRLRGSVLNLAASGQSTHGPKDLADALFHIESAGFRAAKAMEVLRVTEALATTGHADLEATTNAVVGALNSHIKGTKNLSGTAATLNAIIGAGNMRMDELTGAISTGILPRAASLGISLKQVGAALATMTRQGQPAQMSATRFSMAMNMMMAPTNKAAGALQAIGLSSSQLGTMMEKGNLPGALELLRSKLDALGGTAAGRQKQAAAISAIFGGGRTSGGITTILRALDQYRSTLGQINRQGTPKTFEALHQAALQEPGARLHAAWAQIQSMLIRFGDAIVPRAAQALSFLSGILTGLGRAFGSLPKGMQNAIVDLLLLGALVGPLSTGLSYVAGGLGRLIIFLPRAIQMWSALRAAFMVGGLEAVLTQLTAAFPLLGAAIDLAFGPVGLIVLGITALVVGFYLLYTKVQAFRDAVNAVIGFVIGHWKLFLLAIPGIGPVLFLVVTQFNTLKNIGVGAFHAIVGVATFFGKTISFLARLWFGVMTLPFRLAVMFIRAHFGNQITAVFHGIRQVAGAVFGWIGGAASKAAGAVGSAFSHIGNWIKGAFIDVVNAVIDAINWLIGAFNSVFDRTIDTGVPGIPVFHGLHIDPIGNIGKGGQPTLPGTGITQGQFEHGIRSHQRPRHGHDPALPGAAEGAQVVRGGLLEVGERGREIVDLAPPAEIRPLEKGRRSRTVLQPVHLLLDGRKVGEALLRISEDDLARA